MIRPPRTLPRPRGLVGVACLALAGGVNAAPIEEIVVTAQKRQESLQNVGIAIAAFDGERLAELGVTSLRDVPNFVPNVQLFDEYGTGQPTWVIRGVGLADFSANNTPTAAIYVDDVYLTSNVMGGLMLFDVERIEVLKGPQGALYGRNTSGGAVRVVTAQPDTTAFGSDLSVSYGRWGNSIVEGAMNLPVSDTAALRVAGHWNRRDEGWQTSLADGREFGEKDRWAARAGLLVRFGSRTEALLSLHGAADRSETVLGRGIGLYDPLTGSFCDAILAGRLDDQACALNATFYDPSFRFPSVQSAHGERTLSDPFNRLDNESVGGLLRISHELDWATLTSITGLERFDYHLDFDYDGSNGEFGHQRARSDIDVWSQELRLASPAGGTVSWLVGLEYGEDELDENRDFLVGDDAILVAQLGEGANLRYRQRTESIAAYGQVEWSFAPRWKLNLGLRYTDESKRYDDGDFLIFSGGAAFPFFSDLESRADLSIWSGKVGLDFMPTDSTLLYASVSKGFKSGGIFGGFPLNGEEALVPYGEETVYAYEVGFKTQWLEDSLRINGAAFFYDYRDVQGYITAFSDVTQSVLSRLANQGDAEHEGVELDVLWQPNRSLLLQASAAWLSAEIVDSDRVATSWLGTVVPIEGFDRGFAPDFSYSLLGRYEIPLGALRLTLQADYSWRDDRDGGLPLSIIERTLYGQLDSYGLLGARITLADAGGRWEAAAFGSNLTDQSYWANVTNDDFASWMALPGEPRSFGVQFRYHW